MSTHPFPDPFNVGHVDVRTLPNADSVPPEVLDAYGLRGADVARLTTGSYNIHFKVESEQGTFDLRRSNRPIDRSNLAFETEFLAHLRSKDFDLAPLPVATVDGLYNFWLGNTGWTLFEWIEDDDAATDMTVTPGRIRSAATTLARIHLGTRDFHPSERRGDWPIFSRPNEWRDRWAWRSDALADHLGEDGEDLRKQSALATEQISRVDFNQLPELGCHADYRMKNARFSGDRLTTVFDFDTAMMSTRLLDVGGAVTRFSPMAKGTSTPQADVESGSLFLRAYNENFPLTEYEWQVLPVIIPWRIIRDVAIYFDLWWLKVSETTAALLDGAAAEIVEAARS